MECPRCYRKPHDGECPLSRKDSMVIGHLVAGLTDREIGAQVGVAEDTVRKRVLRIKRKLSAKSRAHIAWLIAQQEISRMRIRLEELDR